jgi:cyanate permease
MELQKIKMVVSAAWVAVTLAIAIAAQVPWPFQFAIGALALLPPLALLLWWTDPAQTMTEAIDEVRRGR